MQNIYLGRFQRQDNRLTNVENACQGEPEMWNGVDLNELHGTSVPKMAVNLAVLIKGIIVLIYFLKIKFF